MQRFLFLISMLATVSVNAEVPRELTAHELNAKVIEITDAQNKVMLKGSTPADVDKLFSLYTDDFVYLHEAYGGSYSRSELHGNTLRLLERGIYNQSEPRYTVTATIPGHNSIAVQRQETHGGVTSKHLAVFEFRGEQVSRIIEYWK